MSPVTAKSETTLSVLIPCYNEATTIDRTLDAIAALGRKLAPAGITLQIVAVDDCSRDGTWERLSKRAEASVGMMRIRRHDVNRGKGSAIQTARGEATGDIVVIQDADLEYDPADIPALIAPIVDGRADAVCGTRFGGAGAHRVLYFYHRMGNGALTFLSNMFTNLNLTDMETCYKVFRRSVIQSITIEEERFGFEPEITAKVAKLGCRIYEVGISYYGRTYAEGKKIGYKDGLRAIWCIVKYNLFR